jgi:hypothetical protein
MGLTQEKRFFFEKKNQKTFILKAVAGRGPLIRKSFCVFFQKEALSYLPANRTRGVWRRPWCGGTILTR